jgi:hypothetical protein
MGQFPEAQVFYQPTQYSRDGLRMKVNISLVIFGAVAASAIALPAQAATVNSTTIPPGGGTIARSAFSIDNLLVGGNNYNVTFEYDTRANVYGLPTPEYGAFADTIGEAIVRALRENPIGEGGPITSLIDSTPTVPGTNTVTEFYIPQSNNDPDDLLLPPNSNERLVTHCYTTFPLDAACGSDARSRTQDDVLMYAKFTPTGSTPTPGNPIPTPALIPGLMGMGLAARRKKKQAV